MLLCKISDSLNVKRSERMNSKAWTVARCLQAWVASMCGFDNPLNFLLLWGSLNERGNVLGAIRTGKARVRKQNTYQLCPQPFYTFARHRATLKEFTQGKIETYLKEAQLAENGTITPPFTEWLNSLRDAIVVRQQRLFPRHKIVVHGIIGTVGSNEPTVNFATQTFMAPNCGDDFFGVSYKTSELFASVMVVGFALD
ncbi:unnamed protein product [Echinostoma caproni]|uniref:Dynein_C domain-containing protein n=1 Tax=Echinostoma caproni TaxID=27848 RepID=A0A183A8M7_9TREM|nr:unnamed protein product [Echinostoma caproni]